MAALQCEFCGGKLIGKPGGIFECDSCGMEYSTEWAKAKIQEIKGAVTVEGTVQVEGTVKVEGGKNIESLIELGFRELIKSGESNTNEHKKKAKSLFEEALTYDAQNGDAILGSIIVGKAYEWLAEGPSFHERDCCDTREKFWQRLAHVTPEKRERIIAGTDFQTLLRAKKGSQLLKEIEDYNKQAAEYDRKLEDEQQQEQAKKKQEEEDKNRDNQERIEERAKLRQLIESQILTLNTTLSNECQKQQNEIDTLNKQKSSLGFFKSKEKKELQERIEQLNKDLGEKKSKTELEIRNLKLKANGAIITAPNELIFGRYELAGARTPIEWIILEEQKDRLLITSKYALDAKSYKDRPIWTTWENSDIRYWLNTTFLKVAFDEEEQKLIAESNIKTIAYKDNVYVEKYCEETVDSIFLLSLDEVQKYFINDKIIKLQPTLALKAANPKSVDSNGDYCKWWLRTQKKYRNKFLSIGTRASEMICVPYNGELGNDEENMPSETVSGCTSKNIGIRPAMWLDVSAVG